jgi:hypothetical protein
MSEAVPSSPSFVRLKPLPSHLFNQISSKVNTMGQKRQDVYELTNALVLTSVGTDRALVVVQIVNNDSGQLMRVRPSKTKGGKLIQFKATNALKASTTTWVAVTNCTGEATFLCNLFLKGMHLNRINTFPPMTTYAFPVPASLNLEEGNDYELQVAVAPEVSPFMAPWRKVRWSAPSRILVNLIDVNVTAAGLILRAKAISEEISDADAALADALFGKPSDDPPPPAADPMPTDAPDAPSDASVTKDMATLSVNDTPEEPPANADASGFTNKDLYDFTLAVKMDLLLCYVCGASSTK